MRQVQAGRGDLRVRNNDREQADLIMKDLVVSPISPVEAFDLLESFRIALVEDCSTWFALPSDEVANWGYDRNGDLIRASIYEEDGVQGNSLIEAIQRCVVLIVLGRVIDVPDVVQ
ncbi:hypothetical protein D3C73_1394500 [compost metagenome]